MHNHYDVCIMGAGITGLSCAIHLVKQGYRVIMLEQSRVGAGASGHTPGQLIPGYRSGKTKLFKLLGEKYGQKLWDLTYHKGIDQIKSIIHQYQIQNCLKKNDYYINNILQPEAYCLDVPKYFNHLVKILLDYNILILEHSAVEKMAFFPRLSLKIKHYQITSDYLMIAANAYLGTRFNLNIQRHILPVETYLLKTESLNLPFSCRAVSTGDNFLHYWQYTEHHELVFCLTTSAGLTLSEFIHKTRNEILTIFPEIKNLKVTEIHAAKIALTQNLLPDIGRLSPHIYFAQGYCGRGLVLGAMAGRLIADAIGGEVKDFKNFSLIKHADYSGYSRVFKTDANFIDNLRGSFKKI